MSLKRKATDELDKTAKKRKTSLTSQQKMEIVDLAEKGMTGVEISDKLGIPRGTVWNVTKGKKSSKGRPGPKPRYGSIAKLLLDHCVRCKIDDIPVTQDELTGKAMDIAKALNYTSFRATKGWMQTFLTRNNVALVSHSEIASNESTAENNDGPTATKDAVVSGPDLPISIKKEKVEAILEMARYEWPIRVKQERAEDVETKPDVASLLRIKLEKMDDDVERAATRESALPVSIKLEVPDVHATGTPAIDSDVFANYAKAQFHIEELMELASTAEPVWMQYLMVMDSDCKNKLF